MLQLLCPCVYRRRELKEEWGNEERMGARASQSYLFMVVPSNFFYVRELSVRCNETMTERQNASSISSHLSSTKDSHGGVSRKLLRVQSGSE